MASPQELARQELARRELERRKAQQATEAPEPQVDYAAMTRQVFGPDLENAQTMQLAMAKMPQPARTPAKDLSAAKKTATDTASKYGVFAAGESIIEAGVGLAKMFAENLKHTVNTLGRTMPNIVGLQSVDKQATAVKDWTDTWSDNLDAYKREHPEDFLQLESSGFKNTTKEILSNPVKLVKGAVQSLPLMLEGMLPGGLALMATSSAGQHYMQNREEGDDPEKAALRAWVTAVPEAAIEKFTLNKKINLFHNMKPVIQSGTRKVVWELGKSYMRGVGEEGSQQFNENMWRWVFSDRSTDVFQGVKESAAVGGPLEAIFTGVAMTGGSVKAGMVGKDEKINRVNLIREMVAGNMTDEAQIKEVNDALDKVVTDIEAGKYDQPLTEVQEQGAEYGLSPEHSDQVMSYAESRFQELEAKRKGEGFVRDEIVEWKFLKDHRDDLQALVEQSTNPNNSINYVDPQSGKPVTRTRSQYKNMVMNMVQRLEDQDVARGIGMEEAREGAHGILREAIIQVTGKDRKLRTLKGQQLQDVANYMADFATEGVISEDDWDNFVLLNGKRQKMRTVMEGAYASSESSDVVPQRPKSKLMTRVRERLHGAKNFLVGIENTPLYHLAKRLDGGDEKGVFSQVLDQNIQEGHRVEASLNRRVYDETRKALTDAGITEQDLVRMSTDLDPVRSILRAVSEHLPTQLSGTQQRQNVKLGSRDLKLTWAELIDLYLISGQQDGMRHLIEGGLVIDGQDTGALTPTQIADARKLVESDGRVLAVANLFKDISNKRWRPAVNATSQSLDGRKIATIDNWWGLEVLMPGEVGGEKKEFNVNLIENKSILHARTHGSRPLVLRDAFRRFSVFQGAISNYYGMSEPFRIARTLLNDKTLWDNYRQRGMQDVFDTAQKLLQHAQGTVHAKNVLEAVIDFVMPNTYRALLYYNPKVWMSQYTSVFNYGSYVSRKYMKDVFGSLAHIADRSLWDEMLSVSDVAYERFHTGKATLELGVAGESDAVRRNVLGKSSWGNKAAWMLKAADMAALLAGWETAKAEFKDAQAGKLEGKSNQWWAGEDVMGVEEGTPGYQDLIKRRAEYLWQRTQPSWDVYNRSMITNATKLMRSFLMFRSFHEKVLTIWNDASVDFEASEKSMADAARFAEQVAWPVTSYMANAAMRVLIGWAVYGKKEEIEKVIKDTILSPLDAFPVLGTFLQDALGALFGGLRGEQVYLNDDNLESMPLALLNDMEKDVTGIAYGIGLMASDTDKEGTEAKKAIWDLISKVAIMNGVPAYQVKGIAKRFLGDTESGTTPTEGKVKVEYER